MLTETTLTTLRPLTFYERLQQPDDRCDGLGPTRHMPAGTVCDVLRGNPYKLALCATVADGREWYIWTRADDFNASESGDLQERRFLHMDAAPESIRLQLSADGREIVQEIRTAGPAA